MDLAHLGTPVAPMTRVHGGYSNRLWRLETEQGVFAVKVLRQDRDWTYRPGDVLRVERAAFAAGIPMPEPISADDEVLVHRWVEGKKVPEEPVTMPFGFEIGEILARLHSLEIEWPHELVLEPMPTDWPELADRAAATQQPWADELRAAVDTFLAISALVDGCERRGPVVVTHRDITPWNLLDAGGRPIVLDWEIAGPLHVASELGSTALNLCKDSGFDHIEPSSFRAVLDGYVAGGGTLPEPGVDWFVDMIGGWARFARWNVLRCVAGVE
ncbi:MAG TPA: phosphotransferase, partial [Acidimicrobiales bacterium]|nr:phosphotransferase [Acidimicrobiales bacterium]